MEDYSQVVNKQNFDSIMHPELYKDKLTPEEYKRLKPLFCVQSMEETGVFSSHMRPLCLILHEAEKLNMTQNLNEDNITNLYGLKVGFLRRPLDKCGNKIDTKLIIEEGVIEKIEYYETFNYTNIHINNIPVRANRVFLI
tara:strand:- start:760 stop:1179 length:420 start_codon:yes stop_codon:yes gene_type:complete